MKKHYFLILLLVLASFLRLYKLGSLPPALYWDEASLGYNAFSILKAGIDEHGVSYPITHFLAYGDAKPPLYIYLVSLAMALVGVNEWAVRLPSAIAGILAVWLIYLLAKEISKNWFTKKSKLINKFSLITALLLAISPWHLQMSRAAFEANVALTLFLTGMVLFFKASKKPYLYLLCAVMFVGTWYTFNAYRLFLPPLLLTLGLFYFDELKKHFKWVTGSIVLALLLTAPLIPFVTSDQAKLRFDEVTIFNNLDPVVDANLRIEANNNAIWAKIFYNRRILFGLDFLDGFFDHLKPDFLFFGGDQNPRLGIRDMGMLYLIELPLILLGIAYVYKTRDKLVGLLLIWFILGIMPSAVARETPHALRSLQVIPVIYILLGYGLTKTLADYSKSKYILSIAYLGFFGYYLNTYYAHYGRHWTGSWQYGYKQMVAYIDSVKDDYDQIYITNKYGRPHTYMLFYLQYDPVGYLNNRDAYIDNFGFAETNSFDKFYFTSIPEEVDPDQKILYVVDSEKQIPEDKVLKVIYDLKNNPVFIIYE